MSSPVTDTHTLVLFSFLSHTHLFPHVVHDSHDVRQLSELLFDGTLPLALLLGDRRLLWRDHPRHVSPMNGICSVKIKTLSAPPRQQCAAAAASLLLLSRLAWLASSLQLIVMLWTKRQPVLRELLLENQNRNHKDELSIVIKRCSAVYLVSCSSCGFLLLRFFLLLKIVSFALYRQVR